ncbi:hypothetical protein ACQP00_24695 [Dactylosporangium sp. CS-047395]|uniref:hypothetical protein n=1 Tax=Dactylosporangium sp. CS-047395 TaxID=3239936 RepID=UPI003D906F51
MRAGRRALVAVAVVAVALFAVTLTVRATSASSGGPTNPATAPQPQYDFDDPAKAFAVELDFGASAATLVRATVVGERSYSHLGDPPLLRLFLTDEGGASAGSFNAWDPRWYFEQTPTGAERMVRRDGPGTLFLPFDADTAALRVHDLRAGTDLATVDLRPAVHEFCLANPADGECVQADLAVTSATAAGDPLGVLGKPVTLHAAAGVANLGPAGPVDAVVTQTVAASPGLTVTPASRTFASKDLKVSKDPKSPNIVTYGGDYAVTCTSPGTRTVTVTTSVAPVKAKVADVKPGNDGKPVTFTIDCAVPVAVNVLPGSLTNPVQVVPQGELPVVVLTTNAGEYGNPVAFNAGSIQAPTVRVGVRGPLVAAGTGSAEVHGKVHGEYAPELDETTVDGDRDALLHASLTELGVQPGTTEICVRGRFGPGAGTSFFGCDHITVIP